MRAGLMSRLLFAADESGLKAKIRRNPRVLSYIPWLFLCYEDHCTRAKTYWRMTKQADVPGKSGDEEFKSGQRPVDGCFVSGLALHEGTIHGGDTVNARSALP